MYLSYIDGIRAFAVISVIIYHLDPKLLPGGFSGVDVFFVVSGYVVSLSLDKHRDLKLRDFLMLFYSRRIKRIIPALFFCLLLTIVLTGIFIPKSALTAFQGVTALGAFLGISNIVLAIGNYDYFGPTTEFNPFTHTWSLGIEEQFYFLFPFIFIFWTQERPVFKKASVAIFSILFFASICFCWWLSKFNKLFEYYLIVSRFWQLAAGILLYQFINSSYSRKIDGSKLVFRVLSWFSLGIVLAGFFVSDEAKFPMPWAIMAVCGTFLLLLSMNYVKGGYVSSILNNKFMVLIGKMSYSLYLWHWPIIVLFRWTVGLDTAVKNIFAIVLTIMLASISYFLVETPIRTSRIVAKASRRTIIYAGLSTVFVGLVLGTTLLFAREQYTLTIMKNANDWYTDRYVPEDNNVNCRPVARRESFSSGLKFTYGCLEENSSDSHKIFVLGDSHASAYRPLFYRYAAETGIESSLYTLPGCANPFNDGQEGIGDECKQFITTALRDIMSKGGPGDVVFLPSLKLDRFSEQWASLDVQEVKLKMSRDNTLEKKNAAIDYNHQLMMPLADRGLNIVFEAPKPIFKSPAFRCTEWFNVGNPVCKEGLKVDKDELLVYRYPVMDSLHKLTDILPRSKIYDPFFSLCPNDECEALVGDRPLFFDGDHLSTYGNMVLYEGFKEFLGINYGFKEEQPVSDNKKNPFYSDVYQIIEGGWPTLAVSHLTNVLN